MGGLTKVHDPCAVTTILTFFQKVAHGSLTHTSAVPWTTRRRPSAPRITISLLGVTSSFNAAACHAGIKDTEAPVSNKTVVGLRASDFDFAGTFAAINKLYVGMDVLPSALKLEVTPRSDIVIRGAPC